MGLLVSASTSLLYELARRRGEQEALLHSKEDAEGAKEEKPAVPVHVRVQSFTTRIGTVVTLIDFFTGPLIGRFMDAVGRLPTMATALAVNGTARLLLASRPSLGAYFAYRVLTAVAAPAFFRANVASLGDLYGRGTQGFSAASSAVQRYALLSMIAGTYLGRLIKTPQLAFVLCGAAQLTSVGILSTSQETLAVRTEMDWSLRGLSPMAFAAVYGRSRALVALAVLSSLRELPAYVNIGAVYRRQKFAAWGREQESTEMIVAQICGFLSTFLRVPVMDTLGLQAATRLQAWCQAAADLNSALAPRMELLYLNSVLTLLDCGSSSVDRCLQQEASLVGVGQGELGSAEAKRCFVPSLVMPNVFTTIYTRCSHASPAVPYWLAAGLSLLAAEAATPWAFGRLSPSVMDSAQPRTPL